MLPENNGRIRSVIERKEYADLVRRLSLCHARYRSARDTMNRMATECSNILASVSSDKLEITIRMAGISEKDAKNYSGTTMEGGGRGD